MTNRRFGYLLGLDPDGLEFVAPPGLSDGAAVVSFEERLFRRGGEGKIDRTFAVRMAGDFSFLFVEEVCCVLSGIDSVRILRCVAATLMRLLITGRLKG